MTDIIAMAIAYLIVGSLAVSLAWMAALGFCYFVCPRQSLRVLEWLVLHKWL